MIGFGASIAYLGSIITMGQYFEKRRTLAVALVIAGAGGAIIGHICLYLNLPSVKLFGSWLLF